MTTPTPRTDAAIIRDKMILSEVGPLEIVDAGTSRQLERDLAAAQDNRQYTCEAHRDEVKKGGRCVWCDLNVAHEELNTQAHELERLLNELSAAQERVEDLEVRCANAEARAEAAEKDAGRWRACLDSVGVAVSIFNVDPAGWRYPEGDHLVAAIDNIIEGNEGAWKVPIDTGGPPLRAPFELKAQSRESVEASFYRYLRDEAGGNEDNDGPMICAGLGDQFDFLRGEECDEAIRRAIDARAAIAEGKK